MKALHCLTEEHVRALSGAAAPSDPAFDRAALAGLFDASVALIVCVPTLTEAMAAQVRALCPNAQLAASINAHSLHDSKVSASAWHQGFYAAMRQYQQEDAWPEIRLGLAAYEALAHKAETRVPAWFDAIYWDECWFSLPDWVALQWDGHGTEHSIAVERWFRCRDHFIRRLNRPAIFNTGSTIVDQAENFIGWSVDDRITIEDSHGPIAAIARSLAASDGEAGVCWPSTTAPDRAIVGNLEVEGLILRGVRLPTGVRVTLPPPDHGGQLG